MTDRYAWLGPAPSEPAVVLVAQAPYHLPELDLLAAQLRARGIAAASAIPVVAWKPLHRFRPTVRRLAATVAASGRTVSESVSVAELLGQATALVVMNDWGVPRLLVDAAAAASVPSFGWVEGVQDYDDVDTGHDRRAYRRVDHVFALGPASCELLGSDRTTAVGSERLSAIWHAPPPAAGTNVIISSNFTYGVLADARVSWVDGAVDACTAAGRDWVLSRHVAERGRSRFPVSPESIEALLPRAERLVSRFSTVNLDALASGVEVAYYNPHGEQVAMFAEPLGAFSTAATIGELTDVLRQPTRDRDDVRAGAETFLRHHVLLDDSSTPAARAAEVIGAWIG